MFYIYQPAKPRVTASLWYCSPTAAVRNDLVAPSVELSLSAISVSTEEKPHISSELKLRRGTRSTYLIHDLISPSQPFVFAQVSSRPIIQRHQSCLYPSPLTLLTQYHPRPRVFLVRCPPAGYTCHRNVYDKPFRMREQNVLDLRRRDLCARHL